MGQKFEFRIKISINLPVAQFNQPCSRFGNSFILCPGGGIQIQLLEQNENLEDQCILRKLSLVAETCDSWHYDRHCLACAMYSSIKNLFTSKSSKFGSSPASSRFKIWKIQIVILIGCNMI